MSVLRTRVRDALAMGALHPGDRLPSTRTLAGELEVDPRVVATALRRLADEGLVEVRPRSGVYVALSADASHGEVPALPSSWATDVVVESIERGVAAHRLSAALAALVDTYKVRAAVIAPSVDQTAGIARELRDDYGIAAATIFPEQLTGGSIPAALSRAHVIVTSAGFERPARALAARLRKPMILVSVRPDLFSEDWLAFMQRPVYVVAMDPRFRAALRDVLSNVPGGENVTILLAAKSDLTRIPPDAPTYVTESARRMLGRWGLPGRVVRPRRLFARETVRDIVEFLIRHNEHRRRD